MHAVQARLNKIQPPLLIRFQLFWLKHIKPEHSVSHWSAAELSFRTQFEQRRTANSCSWKESERERWQPNKEGIQFWSWHVCFHLINKHIDCYAKHKLICKAGVGSMKSEAYQLCNVRMFLQRTSETLLYEVYGCGWRFTLFDFVILKWLFIS